MAHVNECDFSGEDDGCQIRPCSPPDGKLTPGRSLPYLHGFLVTSTIRSQVLFIFRSVRELVLTYAGRVEGNHHTCPPTRRMRVHMDECTVPANACAALGALLALTVDCGIDVLGFGGTKKR